MLKKKTPDLLTLPMTYAGDNSPAMPVIPRPPMLAPPLLSPFEAAKKKRKRGKHSRKESFEKGEIPPTFQQEPSKEPRLTRAQQKKSPFEGAGSAVEGEQHVKALF